MARSSRSKQQKQQQQHHHSASSTDDNQNASVASTALNGSTTRVGDEYTQDESAGDSFTNRANGLLDRMFYSCQDDPKGSVHRAWGICLFFIVFYFILAIMESECLSILLSRILGSTKNNHWLG